MKHKKLLILPWYRMRVYLAFRWPRGLISRPATARLLGMRVWIPPRTWMSPLVRVVCGQVEVSATGWSSVKRSPTECEIPILILLRNHENKEVRPTSVVQPRKKGLEFYLEWIMKFLSLIWPQNLATFQVVATPCPEPEEFISYLLSLLRSLCI